MALDQNRRDEDVTLSKFQIISKYIKKNGFLGFLAAASLTLSPTAYTMYKDWSNDITISAVHTAILPLYTTSKELLKELRDTKRLAISAHTKNRLDDKRILDSTQDKVWAASFGKCLWILDYMDSSRFIRDKNVIRSNVEPELMERTMKYVSKLNETVHPELGLIGNYLNSIFEWTPFIDEVIDSMHKEESSILRMLKVVKIMQRYQNKAWYRMRKDMRSNSDR